MEEWNDFAYSKQQTSREATNSEMDPGYFRNTPLSSEETMEKEDMVSHANNAGSADCSTLQETNKDNTLHSKYAFEDQGPDHENSMSEGQDNLDISCNAPHSTLGEVFENNSKEADIKSAKNKIVDATCPNDNSSKTCQQECNVFKAIRPGNHFSVSYTLMKSEDSATAQIVEDDRALNGDGTTELFGVEQKAKEASRPSDSIQAHNEVSNMSPTPEDTDGNASTLNPDDDTDTDACTNTAGNKQQDGGKVCEGRTIDSESKRSAGHGEDLTELLHPAPSIKEADVTEKKDKVCNDITHNDNSSTGLHLEDTSVTTIISPDNNSSKDSSTAGNEKTKCSSGSQSSNNMTTKLSGSEHIDDDFCYSHGGNKSLSTANDTGRNASSISNNDGTNTKDSNITAYSKLQGGGDLDTMEAENKKSMENRRSNNESSCLEPNTDKSDITTAYEENKISPESHRPNNSKGKSKVCDATSPSSISPSHDIVTSVDHPTQYCSPNIFQPECRATLRLTADVPRSKKYRKKACRSKQINKVNYRPNDDNQAHNRVTGATKTDGNASIDDGCNQAINIAKTNTGASSDAYTGRRRRKQCFKRDATTINHNPEDRTSSRDGGENSVLSFLNAKRQDQSQTNETNPIVSDTTGSTCFQKHGDVSTSRTRAPEKSWNGNRGLWNAFTMITITLIMVNTVQASPMRSHLQQTWIWITNESLMNHLLSFKNLNLQESPGCTFCCTSLPCSHNCSELGAIVTMINETYVQMRTSDLEAEHLTLEYGRGLNGKQMPATRGVLLDNEPLVENPSKYNSSHDSFSGKNKTEDKTPNKDEKNNDYTWLIVSFVLIILIAGFIFGILGVLWCFCPKFKSWVKSCMKSNTDSNLNSSTNPSAAPLTSAPTENGNLNKRDDDEDDDEDDDNDDDEEESQRLNPESPEEPHLNTSETSL